MDYYASWPSWRIPKWVGATLGGIFSLILIVCVGLIVHLTRPPRPVVAAHAPADATIVVHSQRAVATEAPPIAKADLPVAAQQRTPAVTKTREASRTRRRAILAKHDAKPGRQAKSELDRLLGL